MSAEEEAYRKRPGNIHSIMAMYRRNERLIWEGTPEERDQAIFELDQFEEGFGGRKRPEPRRTKDVGYK